jgi:hypothetical protein
VEVWGQGLHQNWVKGLRAMGGDHYNHRPRLQRLCLPGAGAAAWAQRAGGLQDNGRFRVDAGRNYNQWQQTKQRNEQSLTSESHTRSQSKSSDGRHCCPVDQCANLSQPKRTHLTTLMHVPIPYRAERE